MKVNSLAMKAIKIAIALASSNWSATAQPPPSDGQKDCRCNPDPHFKTWDGTYYDYHGGCDLVLIKNALMDLHIRTFALPGFSAIMRAGLRVGVDEVTIDGSSSCGSFGTTLGGYPFSCTTVGSSLVYELTLDDGQFVRITDWYNSLSVLVRGGPADFADSVGMCGTWNAGYIARNGDPLANGDEMGDEWKVVFSDDEIISTPATCPTPFPIPFGADFNECPEPENKCLCADPADPQCPCINIEGDGQDAAGRCACKDNTCVTDAEIEDACAAVEPEELKEDCKFDVLTTGDVTWGEAPFYKEPAPPLPDARCTQITSPPGLVKKGIKCEDFKGAQCVFNCVTSRDFVCKPNLCGEDDDTSPFNNKKKGGCACKVPKPFMDAMCSDD